MKKDIEIPSIMKLLKKDKRGYPVPYIAFVDDKRIPQFTITDEKKRQRAITTNLCGICGKKLNPNRALIGGIKAAFEKNGAYIDPPMHLICAQYALKVCPYLAAPNYNKRIDANLLQKTSITEHAIIKDPTVKDARPDFFILVLFKHTHFIKNDFGFIQYVKPLWPYVRIEAWQSGLKLNNEKLKEILEGVGYAY